MSNTIVAPEGAANALSVLESVTPAQLFAENGTMQIFDAIKKEVSCINPDVTTKEGRAEIAALAYKIARSKTFIDKVGEVFNSDLKKKTKAVDAERKIVWDKLEALQTEIRKPLTEWEEKEKARTDGHKAAMAEVESLPQFSEPPTIEKIRQRIERGLELSNRDWEEHREIATDVLFKSSYALGNMLVAAEKVEADRKELEALRMAKVAQDAKDAEIARQKSADEERARIQKEATEKAQRDAEEAIKAANDAAESERQKAIKVEADAEARAKASEEARIAAEARAKLEAEQAVQRERERATSEQKRLDDEAKARENDRQHHRKVNDEIYAGIKGCIEYSNGEIVDDWESIVESIVKALTEGKIRHTKVTY